MGLSARAESTSLKTIWRVAWRISILCGLAALLNTACAVQTRGDDVMVVVEPSEFSLSGADSRQRLAVSKIVVAKGVRKHADVTRRAEYKSLDERVATIGSDGVVVARSDGETTISVSYEGDAIGDVRVSVQDAATRRPMHFRTDVIAALSRGGCSQGACHGSPQGKNGFRMSLRGFQPDIDLQTLTREGYGRRTNVLQPESSLILLKAGGKIAHQGGVRVRPGEGAFETLRQWIAEGTRDSDSRKVDRLEVLPSSRHLTSGTPSQQLVVRAHFTDGGARDVTDLAVFTAATEGPLGVAKDGRIEFSGTAEGAVLVRYLDIIQSIRLTYIEEDSAFEFKRPPVANFIDTHVFAKQKQLQLQPGRLAGDDEFLRRVYLDLVGGIPDPEEARRFIDSDDPRKRAKLVDQLLEREEYAQFWALKWADVMRGNREAITERGVHNFHRYMVHNLEADRPFDEVAREIISSVGDTINAPEANFYRISRTPDVAAESFSQLFLGVRIQCAKCHNHPYEDITQTDYFGLAAHFARVKTKGKRFGLDKEVVFLAPTGEVQVPGLEGDASPAAFRTPTADLVASEDRRDDLAHWLTAPGNEFFARSAVNRVWSHLMGLGVVEPIDDFRDSNPASSPELLDALAKEFADGGYRFKPIVRAIANSTTYQLSSKSRVEQSAQAAAEQRYFIRPVVKLLSAEQIIDAISMATGVPEEFPGYPRGAKAISLAEGEVEHKFLQAFAKPVRDVACDCARETDPTLNQVVHLINNPSILKKIESPENRIAAWRKAGLDVDELIANVYLATVTRRPSAKELSLAKRHLAENGEEVGLQDLQHALINANEFLLRH